MAQLTETDVAREVARALWRRMTPEQQAGIRASWREVFPAWLEQPEYGDAAAE